MRLRKEILINLFLFIFFGAIIKANNSTESFEYNFERIGIEAGLSQSSILSIIQDSRGYMWFGTATGLNRYDGYEFVVYTNDPNDSHSLSDNDVSAIYEDKEGYLWVGTAKGILNRFDPFTETFDKYDMASTSDWYSISEEKYYNYPISFSRNYSGTITSIVADSSENLWIGTWGKGIVRFNPRTLEKKYFYHFRQIMNSLSSNKIVKLLVDSNNYLWVGTFGGYVNRIKINYSEKDEIVVSRLNNALLGNINTSIYEDSQQNIWIGSYSGEISIIKKEHKYLPIEEIIIENFSNVIKTQYQHSELKVMAISEDFESNIWIGTYGEGIYLYSRSTHLIDHIISNKNNSKSLSENEVQSIYVDKSGIVWVGTQLGAGINKLERNYDKFNTVPLLGDEKKSLNDNIIWAIHEDKDENIWFGSFRGGINLWNKKSNEFKYFYKEENLADNHIRVITSDNMGNLWIGSYSGGLSFFNKKKNSFTNYSFNRDDPDALKSNQIQSLLIDGDSLLWIGTFGGGLAKLNLINFYSTGIAKFVSFLHNPANLSTISDDRIYKILKDTNDIYWIGTFGGGLNKFDAKNETFVRYVSNANKKKSITNNRVLSLIKTVNNEILVGMFGGGLDKFNPDTETFENLNESILLNCSDVYGILKDSGNGYWISTNNGIYKLDQNLKSFRQYDLNDGLQSLEFSGGAYCIGMDGTYYFGGINGVNYFNPDIIRANSYLPPIVISRIKVFDELIKGERKNLVFGRDQNYFSFEFASLDFQNSKKNKYKFILEGLDDKWSYTDSKDRRVFYTNLDPGDYTFRVRGTNNDGIWSPKEAFVNITILAPFWMQWWFIASLILLVGGLVTFFINQRIRYLVALDKLKSSIAADLHDNVGAGLTEISILSELAVNEIYEPRSASKHINLISDLSRQLVESMSDIVWVVNPNRDSLYDLIVRLKDTYGELLLSLGIKLKTSSLDELKSIKLPMDYRQNLYLILKESINNSVKHSNCDRIDIEINVNKSWLYICASDNGRGFDANHASPGNGLVNIKNRAKIMGGNIKFTSEKNIGTKIEFEGKLK